EKEEKKATATRELLYNEIERSAQLNWNYVVLVVLSTIVAAIGLIENNVAVVVGAMVIAPLLGPNLAFSLGTALGDTDLMKKSGLTTAVGILLAIALSLLLGLFWPIETSSHELIARTDIGWDSIFLALASGAAASISLTTGLPSVLVGVMVAVALLPPAATFGIFLGKGNIDLAIGAGLLLAINVVCVNLSSKIVFLFKGVRPRTWLEKAKAKRSMLVFVLMWLVTLLILVVSIYARQELDLH
ncbi:MAG: TIGR00341 family protein, partial [Gammaproteobacteria bacterium]